MSQGEGVISAPEPMSMNRTIDVLADPGKMITFLAVGTFPPEKKVTISDVAERSNELQSPYETRHVKAANVKKHCKTLVAAGLIELEKGRVPDSVGPAYILHRTEKGVTAGVAASGAMLGLQLEVPEEGFLERTMSIRADTARDNPRPAFYERLLSGPASITELATAANISMARTTHFVQRLCDDNVLLHQNFIGPENHTYLLATGDFPAAPKNHITDYVLEAAQTLRARNSRIVTGQDLLDEVNRVNPRLPRDTVWHALRTWMAYEPHRRGLIRPQDEWGARSRVDIIPSLVPYIKKMIEMRRLLMGEDKEARDFQAQAREDAQEIVNSPELVAQALGYKSGYTAQTDAGNNWRGAAESIYFSRLEAGELKLSLDELHQQAMERTGRRISIKHFRAHLLGSSRLMLRYEPLQTRNTRLAKYVIGKNIVLSMDWSKAACKDEDPEPFFPFDTTEISVAQADRAKKICESCPVKMPCLGLAIDGRIKRGVRGGIWLDRPEELTSDLRAQIFFMTVKDSDSF